MSACSECGTIDWFSSTGPIDPAEALAGLFGSYDLIGPVDAVGAPTRKVLAYRPPSSKKRAYLAGIPDGVWLKAAPHLWLSHDGEVLLLAPTSPIEFSNLTRGA